MELPGRTGSGSGQLPLSPHSLSYAGLKGHGLTPTYTASYGGQAAFSPRQYSQEPSSQRQQEDAYFTELLSYSLERLSKEPELLKADQDQIRRQKQESAVTHYRAFINTASCLKVIRDDMQGVAQHVDSLLEDMPSLSSVCDQFSQGASTFMAKRTQNKQLQSNHSTLLELLEVPQLMDTCVRNGNYDDALDLRAFVGKLAFMHADLAVVQGLVAEVDATSQAMLQQLLQKLRGSIQLPECLRVIGYLRRLSAFSEQDLRLRFLQCREEWLAEMVDDLDESHAYEYLKRLTDVYRLHLFDVVMQYRAIFSDDSSNQEQQSSDGGLVYSWAEHRVCLYLAALRRHLPRISEGGSLSSVLEHCMYCGMSLARVGLDFRGLLPPIFEACVLSVFAKAAGSAVETFSMVLEMHKWVAMPAMSARSQARRTGSGDGGANPKADAASLADDAAPPYVLMEHVPLAIFTNGLLSAFNELRHCAPLSLCEPIGLLVQEALERVVAAMAHYSATRMLEEPERALFDAACKAVAKVVCPYIAACFGRIYPGSAQLIDVARAAQPLNQLLEERERLEAASQAAKAAAETPARIARTSSAKAGALRRQPSSSGGSMPSVPRPPTGLMVPLAH
ncbi:hypothetical protein WJX72_003806 [[Myrmecia] bisecta]|uniref:Conserved oligomeric Golgi complex subunit 8 n=1 Tax=[Myrmecia] bisecta TaxID=41462 RepID=A0AAW1PRL4_9CHLO